jgi:hypothetical protein
VSTEIEFYLQATNRFHLELLENCPVDAGGTIVRKSYVASHSLQLAINSISTTEDSRKLPGKSGRSSAFREMITDVS